MAAQQLQFDWDRPLSSKGEAGGEKGSVCQVMAASERTQPTKTAVIEEVVRRENLKKALKRVCANKGRPGVDGMTVDELKDYLRVHWPMIREQLLQGGYKPQPVKQVLIPKPGGGTRMLGIPTVASYCTSYLLAWECRGRCLLILEEFLTQSDNSFSFPGSRVIQ
jgi:hypothetical protein